MKRKAIIIIGEKWKNLSVEKLLSNTIELPMKYDGNSIKNTINSLKKFGYEIHLNSYYDFITNTYNRNDLMVISQWILNRFNDTKEIQLDIKKKVNSLVGNGNNFILMHHFDNYFFFQDVLDINIYKGNTRKGYFQNKFSLKILSNHFTTLNVDTFLKYESENLKSDEFTYTFNKNSKFIPLIEKIPKSAEANNFISFGFQKNSNSYIFLIDIHDIGRIKSHSFYFDLLLNNTLFFLSKGL